jgi:hypothetical protein
MTGWMSFRGVSGSKHRKVGKSVRLSGWAFAVHCESGFTSARATIANLQADKKWAVAS